MIESRDLKGQYLRKLVLNLKIARRGVSDPSQ